MNPSCQYLLLAYTLATMLMSAAFFGLLLLAWQSNPQEASPLSWVLPLGFILFLMTFLIWFWLSNSIVGPIYRLEMHMRAVLGGEPVSELRIRVGDQFQTTAELYNRMLKHFGKIGGA